MRNLKIGDYPGLVVLGFLIFSVPMLRITENDAGQILARFAKQRTIIPIR